MVVGIDASRANRSQRTGVEWYAFNMIEQLKQIIPIEHQVWLYSDTPLQGELAKLPGNWEERHLRWPPRRLWTQMRLSLEMLLRPPDVLWIPAHACPLIHPLRTTVTIHDVAAFRFREAYNRFEQWYSLFVPRYALKRARSIIVPSHFTEQELLELLPEARRGEAAKKIRTIYHGYTAPESLVKGDSVKHSEQVLKKYGISRQYLLCVGRLEIKKRTDLLIQAFDRLKQADLGRDLQLVLIGKPGHGSEQVEKVMKDSRFRADIVQPGWVEQEDLPELYRSAAAFVFPSGYEGFGLPALEAFAAGIPLVATRGHSVEEIAQEAAWYADEPTEEALAQAISNALADPHQLEKLEQGKVLLQNFSWEKCARETWDELRGGRS